MKNLSDEKLFDIYKKTGNGECISLIYARHRRHMDGFLRTFLDPDRQDLIEEVIQNSFIQLIKVESVEALGHISLGSWLIQSAQCRATDLIRKVTAKKRFTGVRDSALRADDLSYEEDNAGEIDRRETVALMLRLVHQLPPDEQQAVTLTLNGLSRREGAAELGITPGCFQGLLARGLVSLQGSMSATLESCLA